MGILAREDVKLVRKMIKRDLDEMFWDLTMILLSKDDEEYRIEAERERLESERRARKEDNWIWAIFGGLLGYLFFR
jgi:hypothetical protein